MTITDTIYKKVITKYKKNTEMSSLNCPQTFFPAEISNGI